MNIGLVISVTVHTVLLLATLLTITRVPPFVVPEPPTISISLATPAELQTIAKGERNAKTLKAQGDDGSAAKEPPKQVKTPPPPPPPKEAAPPPPPPSEPVKQAAVAETPPPPVKETPPPPPPGPSPEDRKKLEEAILQDQAKAAEEEARRKAEADAKAKADAEAEKKRLEQARLKKLAEDKKRRDAELAKKRAAEAEARAKAEAAAKAKAFDPNDIMKKIETAQETGEKRALEDKAKPKPAQAAGTKSANAQKGPRAGDVTGTAPLTQGEANQLVAVMRDQLARCWNINSGHPDAARMIPKFEFELNRDGSLRGEPKLVNGDGSPAFVDAANAARRAFQCAAPFKGLPPEKYEHWEYASFTFDPSRMFR